MMKQKKGISPLIATVLLIGFVIVLGVLAFVFLSEQIYDIIEKQGQECSGSQAAVAVIESSGCQFSGLNENSVEVYDLTLANTGQEYVDGVRVRLVGGDETIMSEVELWPMNPGDSGVLHFKNTEEIPDVQSAQIIPFLLEDGDPIFCEQNLVEVSCN